MSEFSSVRCFAATILSLASISIFSCSSGPDRIEPPSISPSGAASQAMELYDADGDGFIAGEELDQAPGIKAAMATIDANNDSKVSKDEIAERIRAWQESRIGVSGVRCAVTLDGQPLQGATVTFEPESFLEEEILAGDGVTDTFGMAYPRIPKDKRPQPDMPGGLQLGFYRVKISKEVNGSETIPARYNSETTLGQQVAPDDPAFIKQRVQFDLKSR